ncbi:HNH/ENDO VII family nuclease [Paenibacillus sp. 19GGS1-52]|nr:HNH/ENDO VII family nuclease [Paenibacillus sp. 19GGS1-52]
MQHFASDAGGTGDLRRPYIRKGVRQEVENRAPKTEDGKFIDPNTGKPIEGKYDLGYKPGNEHWREVEKAKKQGLTQKEFNDRMNNSDKYQIEDPISNRSHKHEMP